MIDYVVRHAHVVIQINYVRQTSVEVLLEVEFSGWQGKYNVFKRRVLQNLLNVFSCAHLYILKGCFLYDK